MPLRIPIVDDHDLVRRGVRSLLESQDGWDVCGEATDGRDAVAQSGRLRPDVVVIDLGLPGLNGLDAIRQILKAAPGTEVDDTDLNWQTCYGFATPRAVPKGSRIEAEVSRPFVYPSTRHATRPSICRLVPSVGALDRGKGTG
jgi:CheY-like chemotaxis protein